MSEQTLIETVEALTQVPVNTVLVDRIGVAWQAGNHVTFEARFLLAVLPMRIVADGSAADA